MCEVIPRHVVIALRIRLRGSPVRQGQSAFALVAVSVSQLSRFPFTDIVPAALRFLESSLGVVHVVQGVDIEARETYPVVGRFLHVVGRILEVLPRFFDQAAIVAGVTSYS